MSRQLDLDYCETHNEPMEYLRESYPNEFPRQRFQSVKNFTRCPECNYTVAEDELVDGLCPDCAKQHHAEINDDSVG